MGCKAADFEAWNRRKAGPLWLLSQPRSGMEPPVIALFATVFVITVALASAADAMILPD
jgi:hypothetical protein